MAVSSPLDSTHPAAHDGFPEPLQVAPWCSLPAGTSPCLACPPALGTPSLPLSGSQRVLEQNPRAQPLGRRAAALAACSPAKLAPSPAHPMGHGHCVGEPPQSPALGAEAAPCSCLLGSPRWGIQGGSEQRRQPPAEALPWALCWSQRKNGPDCPVCWGPGPETRREAQQLRAGLGPQQRAQELPTPSSSWQLQGHHSVALL